MEIFSDNTLMLQVKEGDLDKMGLLFQRHHQALYGFLYRMTGQKEQSEDLVQNVFFRMLKYRHAFAGSGEFKTWMYHVARNALSDHFKRSGKKKSVYELSVVENKVMAEHRSDAMIESRQNKQLLEKAMNSLSNENRELLILCRFQELKYKEVATILNINEGAVKVRVHRALSELKNIYQQLSNK